MTTPRLSHEHDSDEQAGANAFDCDALHRCRPGIEEREDLHSAEANRDRLSKAVQNAAGFGLLLALVVVGIVVILRIEDTLKFESCLWSGRHNCTQADTEK